MSKELLKALTDVLDDLKLRRNLSEDDALNISDSVLMRAEKAIENYLAQPEQVTIGWMYDYISPTSVKHTTAIFDEYPPEDWMINIRPLYTSPQKREPIDTRMITLEMFSEGIDIDYKNGYIAGIRFAEKEHGIGE